MDLGTSLKRRLRRVVHNLYNREPKSKQGSQHGSSAPNALTRTCTPVRPHRTRSQTPTRGAHSLHARGRSTMEPTFELQTDKVDQPSRLLGLPLELLLEILEIVSLATPVKSTCHRYPLISLRL